MTPNRKSLLAIAAVCCGLIAQRATLRFDNPREGHWFDAPTSLGIPLEAVMAVDFVAFATISVLLWRRFQTNPRRAEPLAAYGTNWFSLRALLMGVAVVAIVASVIAWQRDRQVFHSAMFSHKDSVEISRLLRQDPRFRWCEIRSVTEFAFDEVHVITDHNLIFYVRKTAHGWEIYNVSPEI